jgi:hypothetical protein
VADAAEAVAFEAMAVSVAVGVFGEAAGVLVSGAVSEATVIGKIAIAAGALAADGLFVAATDRA